jgi:hypothetical protein
MRIVRVGFTDLYNRFHDPGVDDDYIARLRELHLTLDHAVRDAYGWQDLNLDHAFHEVPSLPENDRIRFTVCEPARLEILRRLSKLNRERWQAEQRVATTSGQGRAAAYPARQKRRVKRAARDTGQPGLPFTEPAD